MGAPCSSAPLVGVFSAVGGRVSDLRVASSAAHEPCKLDVAQAAVARNVAPRHEPRDDLK